MFDMTFYNLSKRNIDFQLFISIKIKAVRTTCFNYVD